MQSILKPVNNQSEITDPIKQRVIKYLMDNEWGFQQGDFSLFVRARCKNAAFPIYIFVFEESTTICVYSYLGTVIPENKTAEIAEFCTRVNYDMPNGNFEFDMDEGEVRYKTSMIIGSNIELLTDEMIDHLIWGNCDCMDLYYSGFMKINYSNDVDIKAIIKEIENPDV